MFKKKRKKIEFNNYMEESAFTAGLQYSQMMKRIDFHDSDLTSDIILNEQYEILSAKDIFKKEKSLE